LYILFITPFILIAVECTYKFQASVLAYTLYPVLKICRSIHNGALNKIVVLVIK